MPISKAVLAAVAFAARCTAPAGAPEWPIPPPTMGVPFAAGRPADVLAAPCSDG